MSVIAKTKLFKLISEHIKLTGLTCYSPKWVKNSFNLTMVSCVYSKVSRKRIAKRTKSCQRPLFVYVTIVVVIAIKFAISNVDQLANNPQQ